MRNNTLQIERNRGEKIISIANWMKSDIAASAKQEYRVNPPINDLNKCNNIINNTKLKEPVSPLTIEQVNLLRDYFFNNEDYYKSMPTNRRNYLYIVLSLNLMRRCGDMIKLRVCDVLNEDGSFKDHVIFAKEEKTGKKSIVYLNDKCKEALIEYFSIQENYKMSDWLFPNYKRPGKHMTVDGMKKMLQRTCDKLKIDVHVGTHSLRKTLPYIAISNSTSIEDEVMISQILGHRDVRTTYHYIGRRQEELDRFIAKNAL